MTSGGHFLSYASLHLTEVALAYDCGEHPEHTKKNPLYMGDFATNAVHPSVIRQLAWMAIALPVLSKDPEREFPDDAKTPNHDLISGTFRRRPLLALIAMLEDANVEISTKQKKKGKGTYTRPEYEKSMPVMCSSDLMKEEIRMEMEVTMVVVAQLRKALDVDDLHDELRQGLWWDPGEVCEIGRAFDKTA